MALEIKIKSPFDAVRHGLALVPDDRKGKGLVTNASVEFNLGSDEPQSRAAAIDAASGARQGGPFAIWASRSQT